MTKNKKKIIVAMSPYKSLRDSTGQAVGAKRKRIVVAMSGGVDSSVAAKLLKDQGHELMGIFLHFWREDSATIPLSGTDPRPRTAQRGRHSNVNRRDSGFSEAENKCCSLSALQDARQVCQKIGIPLYTLNFSETFKKQVVDNFLNEYKGGRTPNPCVRCNKLVKLGLLISKAKELGFDYVATGHYACLRQEAPNDKLPAYATSYAEASEVKKASVGKQITNKIKNSCLAGRQAKFKIQKFRLFRGKDNNKDQSYFLWSLSQEQLKHLIFPLGDYTKPEARRLAKKFNLPVATKSESQEVCFIPEKSHNEFLKRNIKMKSGVILTLDGKRVGEHKGLPLYTIGQRKGIEIGGIGPFYAVRMDYKKNVLYVTNERDNPALFTNQFKVGNVNWISGEELKMPLKCEVVIRYRHLPVKCEIKKQESKKTITARAGQGKQEEYLVELGEAQRAVTSGQSAVFYIGDEVIGGGVIRG